MASDLISRDALKDEMVKDLASTMRMTEMHKGDMAIRVLNKIDEAHTIEAEPVRHGEWVKMVFTDSGKFAGYKCSECGLIAKRKFSYCHCGAKMDGGKQDA